MEIKIDDYVVRLSYNCDVVFKVIDIKDDIYYLKGVDVRLYADSNIQDLKKIEYKNDDSYFEKNIEDKLLLDRDNYFYLPGKILHFDGDKDYLKRSLDFYKKAQVYAVGKNIKEDLLPSQINKYLKEIKPDIVIITGHDAFYKNKGSKNDNNNYQNSLNFVKSVINARKYEKSHEKLVIIAGACQSNYEELIKAGANYASSPKRINIHALDPAIIAVTLALTERSKKIDLIDLLQRTKYGHDGIGGIMGNGLMYVGYPR